ncbi:macrolide 2'-phosphotransferase [Oligoflexus tunisiensis]|uniref:macrolide 2'-phosphotransferase n=1 Tax=Oligoflexus tunisiensis TaxID=708132 RepID=UPI00114D359F|nr:macrolide 2'-phosphotransferase [Oligoflexus tunisiensis]
MIQDIPSLLQRAQSYGLKLITDKKEFDQSGLDFLVLNAQDENGVEWILRAPRRPNAYQGSINEAKILKLLGPRLSVAVPNWKIHEVDLIAYPRLPGTPAWTYDPQEGLRWNGLNVSGPQDTFMESSARFLAELHRVDKKDVLAAGGRQVSIPETRSKLLKGCETTRNFLQPSETVWQRWMHWLHEDSYWPNEAALVHGDLHPGHMLLDDSLRLIGVLDWTEAEIADAAVDFGVFFGCFGEEQLRKLLDLYAQAGGTTYDRMATHIMERWAANAAFTAQWGMDNNQEDVMNFAKQRLAGLEAEMLAESGRN